MRRLLAQLLLVLGLPLGFVLAAAGPAAACPTPELTLAQQLRQDLLFVGTVRDVDRRGQGEARTATYTVEVDRWWRGSPGPQLQVTSPVAEAECGLRLQTGTTYLFVAAAGDRDGAPARAMSHQGTRETGPRLERRISRLLREQPQDPVVDRAPTESEPPEATVLDDSEPPKVAEAVTPAALVVLVGALVLAAGSFLGRRSR